MFDSFKNLFNHYSRKIKNWWYSADTIQQEDEPLIINETTDGKNSEQASSYVAISAFIQSLAKSIFNITTTAGSAGEIIGVLSRTIASCSETNQKCLTKISLGSNYSAVLIAIINLGVDLFPHQSKKVWEVIRNITSNFGLALHCMLALQTDVARMGGSTGEVYESDGAFAAEVIGAFVCAVLMNDDVRALITAAVEKKFCAKESESEDDNEETTHQTTPGIFAKASDAFFSWINGCFSGRGVALNIEEFINKGANTFAGTWTRYGIGLSYGALLGVVGYFYQPAAPASEKPTGVNGLETSNKFLSMFFFSTSLIKNLNSLRHETGSQNVHFILLTTFWSAVALTVIGRAGYQAYQKSMEVVVAADVAEATEEKAPYDARVDLIQTTSTSSYVADDEDPDVDYSSNRATSPAP